MQTIDYRTPKQKAWEAYYVIYDNTVIPRAFAKGILVGGKVVFDVYTALPRAIIGCTVRRIKSQLNR